MGLLFRFARNPNPPSSPAGGWVGPTCSRARRQPVYALLHPASARAPTPVFTPTPAPATAATTAAPTTVPKCRYHIAALERELLPAFTARGFVPAGAYPHRLVPRGRKGCRWQQCFWKRSSAGASAWSARQVLCGLQQIQATGVVHGDVQVAEYPCRNRCSPSRALDRF